MPNQLSQVIVDYLLERSQATPVLTPQDAQVWDRLKGAIAGRYGYTRFNIRLGNGRQPEAPASAEERAMWEALTQYRCDVAVVCVDHLFLVELKPRAIPALNGQLLSYSAAIVGTPFDDPQVTLLGVCLYGDPAVEAVAEANDLIIAPLDNPLKAARIWNPTLNPEALT